MAAASTVFVYEGTDKQGKKTKGEITSSNANVAKAELRKQGINPTKVSKKGGGFNLAKMGAKVTPGDIALFTRQLATMMKAGVPLVQSFEIVADGMDNPAMKDLILKIRDEVSSGNSFAHAIKTQPEYFDDLFCNLVEAGEQSGALETMLDRLATYKEKTEALKAKIKSAMNYPIAVLVVAGVVSGILLVKVVPQFEEIFAGFGAELPEFTQMVVDMSRFMQEWWFAGLAALGAIFFAYKEAHKRSKAVRDGQERMMLKLPILGDILDKSCVARFARTLSTTFAAGVPLVDALESVAGAAGNIVYLEAINKIKEDVSSGIQLNTSMKSAGVFPNMVIQMVAIGEESGALDGMLDKAATYYEEMVDNAVEGLTSLMEPLIMSFLGVVIGGLIIAMYLPIFGMGDAIGGG
ncbi:MAG: type II secretion system F family protein [Pseudomonadales bacterium]|jgi:type IV pilus assembly protein PilC|nr:type II secretion system F family protein [Pseudomonadales bacterium]